MSDQTIVIGDGVAASTYRHALLKAMNRFMAPFFHRLPSLRAAPAGLRGHWLWAQCSWPGNHR